MWNCDGLLNYSQIWYFVNFTRLKALFNYPKWMEIVWLPSASEVRSLVLFTWPNLNVRNLKTTLSSGFSKLGLCSTIGLYLFYYVCQKLSFCDALGSFQRAKSNKNKDKIILFWKKIRLSPKQRNKNPQWKLRNWINP